MNIDEFLTENNFDIGRISPIAADAFEQGGVRQGTPYSTQADEGSPLMLEDIEMENEQSIGSPSDSFAMPNTPTNDYELNYNVGKFQQTTSYQSKPKKDIKEGGNDFLYVESKRARLEREKEERRRKEETSIEFSAEELALATIPGADFDPTRRHFNPDELRPQPIIRKRQKLYVDFEKKDDKYWEKRGKNNIAARRSREARRLIENQIAGLKAALTDANLKNKTLEMETRILKERL